MNWALGLRAGAFLLSVTAHYVNMLFFMTYNLGVCITVLSHQYAGVLVSGGAWNRCWENRV